MILNKKIISFTLSEILIVIGIIGLIASMTLPTIVNNARNKELESRFKKYYSLLGQMVQLVVENEYGGVTELSQTDYAQFGGYLKQYAGSARKVGEIRWGTGDSSSFMKETYKTYTGNTASGIFNDYAFYTSDGNATVFLDTGHAHSVPDIFVAIDINNIDNKPNRYGFDLFGFYVDKKGRLLPFGEQNTPYPEERYCIGASSNVENGLGCTRKALTDPKYFTRLH